MCRQLKRKALPPEFFSEVLLHLTLFLGYPTVPEALGVLSHSVGHRLRSPSLAPRGRSTVKKGRALFRSVYGKQTHRVLLNLDRLHPGLATHILDEAYGRIMSRGGIDFSEREIVNVVILFIQGYRKQLYSHLRGALRSGVQRVELANVLRYTGSLSSLDAKSVIRILEKINARGAPRPF